MGVLFGSELIAFDDTKQKFAFDIGGSLTYLETNGIIDAGIFYALGLVIYFVMRYRARAAGVDEKMLFTELPPD